MANPNCCCCADCNGAPKPITHFGSMGIHSGYFDLRNTKGYLDGSHDVAEIGIHRSGLLLAWFRSTGVNAVTGMLYSRMRDLAKNEGLGKVKTP